MATPNTRKITWNTTIQLSVVVSLLSMAFLLGKWKSEQENAHENAIRELRDLRAATEKCWTQGHMHTYTELLQAQNPTLTIPDPETIK